MIAIIDYGMGNLRSVQKAFEKVGADARITHDPHVIAEAGKVVLPGVGAMQPAMLRLSELDLIDPIKQVVRSGRLLMGICLGLQLLFDESREGGQVNGLGIVPGRVERFSALKVPHMGWNQISTVNQSCPMYRHIENGSNVYFCHSYFVAPTDRAVTASTTEYGVSFVSSICRDNVWGVQYHPEKSQTIGLQILKNFAEI